MVARPVAAQDVREHSVHGRGHESDRQATDRAVAGVPDDAGRPLCIVEQAARRAAIRLNMTQPRGRDAATKRALVTQVSAAAAVATGTAEEAFRAWIVEVSPDEVSVGGTAWGTGAAREKGEATR